MLPTAVYKWLSSAHTNNYLLAYVTAQQTPLQYMALRTQQRRAHNKEIRSANPLQTILETESPGIWLDSILTSPWKTLLNYSMQQSRSWEAKMS
jgi:hypothetical protein